MTYYFTSDTHFGHTNIIKHAQRPFKGVQEMGEEMIRRWNEAVVPGDIVYHLGDFTFQGKKRAGYYFSRLRGKIHILGYPWHHDKGWVKGTPVFHSASEHEVVIESPMVVLELENLRREQVKGFSTGITLCHYPVARWDRSHHGAWHLHGHSHGGYKREGRGFILDVGVDCHDFYPVSLERVEKIMAGTQRAGSQA